MGMILIDTLRSQISQFSSHMSRSSAEKENKN